MFQTEADSEIEFTNRNDLFEWAGKEENSISRLSVSGMLDNGSSFFDDECFGSSDFKLAFTEEGLKALCYKLGFPVLALNMTTEKGLASRILNDLLGKDKFVKSEFVVEGKDSGKFDGHICGIVSESYVGYSNNAFLKDIDKVLSKTDLSFSGKLTFKEACSINTRLHLRLMSTHTCGIVRSRNGISEDKTEIGLEFCNSMVGDTAVSIGYFLNRLVCANGLVLPAGGNGAKIIHTGKYQTFMSRLEKAFIEVFSGLGEKATYVNQLSEIEFLPQKLAVLGLSKMIFDIIPQSKSTVIEINRSIFKEFLFKKLNLKDTIKREMLAIKHLPLCFAGNLSETVFKSGHRTNASMFDLINVFTEYAKDKPPAERVGIQKRSGQLAEWVIKNKKKFK